MSAAELLASLLAEDVDAARSRADRVFDDVGTGRPVVLVGAGNLGKRAAAAMRAGGDIPTVFADRDSRRAGQLVDGVPVMTLADATARHADAVFVVTIWGAHSHHRIAATQRELADLGVTRMAPCAHLFWKYRAGLPHYLLDLPHHVLEHSAEVTRALALFGEETSRTEFVAQVRARLTGEVHNLGEPVALPQYLADDLIAWREDESVVDGGAFAGDTLTSWIAHRGTVFSAWHAFEPQPDNAEVFARTVLSLPQDIRDRVTLYPVALGTQHGRTAFSAAGGADANASATGALTVDVAALDELRLTPPPSFVKLDIEGAEIDALAGMRETVRRHRPVLAVCVYHRQDHMWRVPLAIASVCDGYDFFLRPHGAEGWDLVCYAVPVERRVRTMPMSGVHAQ